ncbi:MAG: sigma-70 family RNA polymerase sigma factor, partial [Actinomycetota bacterium]
MAVDFTAERATGDLLLSASRGDRAAVDELYRRHKPAGVGYARRRGAEDPEAIYDHVFVDVLAKADYLATERPNAFVAYLNRSIKNRIIQEARRQRPMVTLEGDRIERREAEASFEDLVVGNSWVDEAFAQLTEAQREVMTGRYIEQRSLADVATRLGKSPSAVRQLHQAALRKLRLLLAAGAVLLAVAAAAWIVRELARTSVDTSPIDRVGESEETPTELDGPGDEQGLAPAAVIERSAEGPNRLASADPQGSPADLDPNEADAGGPAGPSTTASSPPPSAPTETTEPGTTPTSLGPPASATPTTDSTPGD